MGPPFNRAPRPHFTGIECLPPLPLPGLILPVRGAYFTSKMGPKGAYFTGKKGPPLISNYLHTTGEIGCYKIKFHAVGTLTMVERLRIEAESLRIEV